MKRIGLLWRHLSRSPPVLVRRSLPRLCLGAAACGLLGGVYSRREELLAAADDHWRRWAAAAARVDGGGDREDVSGPGNVNFIADLVEKVLPAVVFIETGSANVFGHLPSSGSGFIVREDGLILTNSHVVGNKRQVRVRLASGKTLSGTVVAVDGVVDVALVSVSANDLPTMPMGRSGSLRTGEWVVALGSPHFLTNSVTVGVVSAKERDLGHVRGMKYIQTDAVITHGNSGGPLVNVRGEVVGINTLKLESGIGFAVPADVISDFLDDALRQMEKKPAGGGGGLLGRWFSTDQAQVVHGPAGAKPYLGISMLTLDANILRDLSLIRPGYFRGISHGVLVHSVHPNSPADACGLKPFDVIVSVNDSKVHDARQVHAAVSKAGPEVLKMGVVRGGRAISLEVKPEFIDDR